MGTNPDYRPIYERVSELQRTKAEKSAALEDQIRNSEKVNFPFKPVINDRSRKMAQRREKFLLSTIESHNSSNHQTSNNGRNTETLAVCDRLLQEGKLLRDRRNALFQRTQEELAIEMQPAQVSRGSEIIILKNGDAE